MKLVQITPGAGAMYCGNCLRDNALVAALRQLGHTAWMVPVYLPLTLDEPNQSAGMPLFFNGINVYLEQKSALYRHAPAFLHRLLTSPRLLNWAARKALSSRPEGLGELTLSMLRGEQGNQARELETLITWLKTQSGADAVCLSNALLIGMARRLKAELKVPVLCGLQGEDTFLDALPPAHRERCWQTLATRAGDIDCFIAPSRFFAQRMSKRLGLSAARVRVIWNGIKLHEYQQKTGAPLPPAEPVLGYFARMCPEKGLDRLVEAFIEIRKRGRIPGLRLRVGGSCGPVDALFVEKLRTRLAKQNLLNAVEVLPNLSHEAKIEFLKSLTVFSVPALYGEAFGLYVIEALAAGVPVVEPRSGAFPELLENTCGGVLYNPAESQGLAQALEELLLEPERIRALGAAGQKAVFEKFTAQAMARAVVETLHPLVQSSLSRT